MSEVNELNDQTPEEMVEIIEDEVEDADIVPIPIDPTLQNEGEAADAKATGDAIAAVLTGAEVNGKTFNQQKKLTLLAADLKMSSDLDAKTVKQAIEDAEGRTASDIMYDAEEMETVEDAINGIKTEAASDFSAEDVAGILDEVFGGDE